MSAAAREAWYALAIDGVPVLFGSCDELDFDGDAWAAAAGFATYHAGLALPTSLDAAIDIRSGSFLDTSAELEIVDVTGELAELFGGALADADLLIDTIDPTDDPAPASVWGKCVGAETIGPAGERRMHSCTPGFAAGMRHLGQQHAWACGMAATPVTDSPRVWVGRRCSIRRVLRIGGDWQAWEDAREVWRGTLLGQGDHDAGRWKIRAAGPESWVAGNLGGAVASIGVRAVPLFALDAEAGDTTMRAWLDLVRLDLLADLDAQEEGDPPPPVHHTWVDGLEDSTYLVGVTTYEDAVNALKSFLADVRTDAGSGQAFEFAGSASTITASTSPGDDGISIRWDRLAEDVSGFDPAVNAARWTARLRLEVTEKVARIWGYDPRQQNSDRDPLAVDEYGQWEPADEFGLRWIGTFYSADAQAMAAFESGDWSGLFVPGNVGAHFYNFGFSRRWPPLYSGGAVSWDMGVTGQEFQLATLDPVHLVASRNRPRPADPLDPTQPLEIGGGVGEATHQGLLVVEGPYRRRGDAGSGSVVEGYAFQVERERREGKSVQVLRAAWRVNPDGSLALDSDGFPRLVTYEWIDPRAHGFDWRRLDGLWSGWRTPPDDGQPITVRPLVVFDYATQGNRVDLAMLRVLATTGTVGAWYEDDSYMVEVFGLAAPSAIPEPGVNDLGASIVTDAEVAELGLAVPASLIAEPEEWEAAVVSVGPSLSRCKIAFAGAVSARGMFDSLLGPMGLAWSLSGGRYGLIDPWTMPSPDDAVAHLTVEAYAGRPGDPSSARASQRLREWSPIDVLTVKARVDPVSGSYLREFTRRATDLGAAYRAQTVQQLADGAHLVHPGLTILGAEWQTDLVQRWARGFDFWARQHFVAEVQLHAEEGLPLWPGDPVTLTDPWLADPSGSGYGISGASGRVISRSFDAQRETVALRVMLNVETAWLRYAPAALATRYDEDDEDEGYRLAVADDWLGMRTGGALDVDGFAEPDWSVEGGNALIEVLTGDGVTWSRPGIYGEVASITATPGDCWINLTGPLMGATWLRDEYHLVVLRERAEQTAAWVLAWHAPICDEDGLADGDPGSKWRG